MAKSVTKPRAEQPETPAERAARLRRELMSEGAQAAALASAEPGALASPAPVAEPDTRPPESRPGARPEDTARLDHLGLDHWTILRDVGPVGDGPFWAATTVSYAEADAAIGTILEAGWDLTDVRPLGYGPNGIRILWQFDRPRASGQPKLTEARHVSRTISAAGTLGGITSFQADALITGLRRDGWKLVCSVPMAPTADGIPFLWVFVR